VLSGTFTNEESSPATATKEIGDRVWKREYNGRPYSMSVLSPA